jgi:zinc protease
LYVETFQESIDQLNKLTLSDVKTFHIQYFGANNLHVGIVGDFNTKEVASTFETLFTTWDSKADFARIKDEYKKVDAQNIIFDTPDKENATFVAALMLPIGLDHEDAAAIELGNYIFGGGFLNSRLATRLRQQDGLSYSAGSFISQLPMTQKSTFGAYAICAPQNLAQVEVGFKEELARLLKDGFTDEEIAAAKSGLLQEKRVSRAQDNELVSTLRRNIRLDRDMQWYKEYETRMSSLSAKDVQNAMKKYFAIEDFSIVKAGDMTKANAGDTN